MSAVREAIEAANLPELIAEHCGHEATRGLHAERGGLIRDPRPGHGERNASFSVFKRGGVWRWKRHGGDDAGGDAYGFLLALGFTPQQAREDLLRRAGLGAWGEWTAPTPKVARIYGVLDEAQEALSRCAPLSEEERARLRAVLAPLSEDDEAARELQGRGLWGSKALQACRLVREYKTRDGRLLASPGALALIVRGPDGQAWAVKLRNLGTSEELERAGRMRYVYRSPGHGSPAWCSPSYGQGETLLIVEGEMNAAAAFLASRAAGLSLDVQGLAGAGSWPHLEGMKGRVVYLYADGDEAGRACLVRLTVLTRELGAREVKALPFLEGLRDFCDVLGEDGPDTLGTWLLEAFEAARPFEVKGTASNKSRAQTRENDLRQSGNAYQVGGWAAPKGW